MMRRAKGKDLRKKKGGENVKGQGLDFMIRGLTDFAMKV